MNSLKILLLSLLSIFAVGCSNEDLASAGKTLGEAYNTSNRENVIGNWKSRVDDRPECAGFKARFDRAGKRHQSAASGAFANDMMKIMGDVKAAGCEFKA